jgi:small-conductance mechanosensitive channel
LIARDATAKNTAMSLPAVHAWFVENQLGLLIGALVAAAIVAVLLLLRWLGQRAVERDVDARTWRGVIGRALTHTTVMFMVVAAADGFSTYADLPHKVARLIDILFVVAFALQGAIWGRELVLGMIGHRVARQDSPGALGSAMAIIRVLVSVTLFAIAAILILDNLGVNVTALVAGLGIGGIAIGLAAQGIFSDLFAALSILFDKPFKKGDLVRYDDSIGTVERIGLKTTRLRSLTGEQLIMANTKLLEREIHNLAQAKARRITLKFGVTYQTPPEMLERMTEFGSEAVAGLKGCKPVRCVVTAFGPSSLDHELVYDDTSRDNDVLANNRAAIILALMKRFAAEKVDFAYPTQTTFTAAPDGTMVMPYATPIR